jgi:hypothetical protein
MPFDFEYQELFLLLLADPACGRHREVKPDDPAFQDAAEPVRLVLSGVHDRPSVEVEQLVLKQYVIPQLESLDQPTTSQGQS